MNEVTTIVRYPFQMAYQAAQRSVLAWYENVEIGGSKQKKKLTTPEHQRSSTSPHHNSQSQLRNSYFNGPSSHSSTLAPSPDITSEHDIHLPPGTVLKSRWNSYTIGDRIEINPLGQVYQARSRNDDEVLIQEYQLSKDGLNPQEIEERQKAFERLIELNLGLGNGPDFRIVKLMDAISLNKERCCYLITRPIHPSISLDRYLEQQPNLSPKQVREALRQILESLQFLHESYRVYYPSEESERGLPHGNINLNSLLIRHIGFNTLEGDQQFFIYLTHLALWEHLFYPPGSSHFHDKIAQTFQDLGSARKDLEDLGTVGFHLLVGKSETLSNPPSNLPNHPAWQQVRDRPLKEFIEQLLGLEEPFRSAEEAIQRLLALPEPLSSTFDTVTIIDAEGSPQNSAENSSVPPIPKTTLLGGAAVLTLGFLGFFSWVAWRQVSTPGNPSPLPSWVSKPKITTFRSINSLPNAPTTYTYGVEKGAWDFALKQTFFAPDRSGEENVKQNLISALQCSYTNLKLEEVYAPNLSDDSTRQANRFRVRNRRNRNRTGQDTTIDRNPCLTLQAESFNQNVKPNRFTKDQLLAQIESGKVQFGLMQVSEKLPSALYQKSLQQEAIAADALVVIVPFGDPYISKKAVNDLQGRITVEELRTIFTGEKDVTQLRGQSVKLFFSEDLATTQLFHQLVLNNNKELINKFENLRMKAQVRDNKANIGQRQTRDIYNRMWVDFNRQTGKKVIGIGFDRLGRMFNQCSVYPLAVSQGNKPPVQVLIKSTYEPISSDFDLCSSKGSYFPNLQNYPLSYELGVVSRKNSPAGKAIAEILNTTEGQYLLSDIGVVPKEPMQTLVQAVWGKNE